MSRDWAAGCSGAASAANAATAAAAMPHQNRKHVAMVHSLRVVGSKSLPGEPPSFRYTESLCRKRRRRKSNPCRPRVALRGRGSPLSLLRRRADNDLRRLLQPITQRLAQPILVHFLDLALHVLELDLL